MAVALLGGVVESTENAEAVWAIRLKQEGLIMKHISKVSRPMKAAMKPNMPEVPGLEELQALLDQFICQLMPDKEKCAE